MFSKWFKKKEPEIKTPRKYKLTVINHKTSRNETHNITAYSANFFMSFNGVICHEFWDSNGKLIRVVRESSEYIVTHIEIT